MAEMFLCVRVYGSPKSLHLNPWRRIMYYENAHFGVHPILRIFHPNGCVHEWIVVNLINYGICGYPWLALLSDDTRKNDEHTQDKSVERGQPYVERCWTDWPCVSFGRTSHDMSWSSWSQKLAGVRSVVPIAFPNWFTNPWVSGNIFTKKTPVLSDCLPSIWWCFVKCSPCNPCNPLNQIFRCIPSGRLT